MLLVVAKPALAPAALSREDVLRFLRRFGRNTNSFLLTYGECDWFCPEQPLGVIPYVRSGRSMIVVGDPLCGREDAASLLAALTEQAGNGQRVVLLLASSWLVGDLRAAGYGALEVGSDACFDLLNWAPRGNRAKKVRSATNLARRSDVTASAYGGGRISR